VENNLFTKIKKFTRKTGALKSGGKASASLAPLKHTTGHTTHAKTIWSR